MKVTHDGRRINVDVTADGVGLVSHAGSGLLTGIADRVGLTRALSEGLVGVRERRAGHDPGRVIRDLAVMLADGGDWNSAVPEPELIAAGGKSGCLEREQNADRKVAFAEAVSAFNRNQAFKLA